MPSKWDRVKVLNYFTYAEIIFLLASTLTVYGLVIYWLKLQRITLCFVFYFSTHIHCCVGLVIRFFFSFSMWMIHLRNISCCMCVNSPMRWILRWWVWNMSKEQEWVEVDRADEIDREESLRVEAYNDIVVFRSKPHSISCHCREPSEPLDALEPKTNKWEIYTKLYFFSLFLPAFTSSFCQQSTQYSIFILKIDAKGQNCLVWQTSEMIKNFLIFVVAVAVFFTISKPYVIVYLIKVRLHFRFIWQLQSLYHTIHRSQKNIVLNVHLVSYLRVAMALPGRKKKLCFDRKFIFHALKFSINHTNRDRKRMKTE